MDYLITDIEEQVLSDALLTLGCHFRGIIMFRYSETCAYEKLNYTDLYNKHGKRFVFKFSN